MDANDIWEDGKTVAKVPEENISLILADELLKARDISGMTQKQLADRTGIYQADISKIERGIGNPSISTLKRLADGMGMDLKFIFTPKATMEAK